MTIRADLHVHAKVCKAEEFSPQHFESIVERARRMGLSGFALTEHLRRYTYRGGHFSVGEGFNVLTGAELTVAERVDIVLIGDIEQLGLFDRSFRPGRPAW